jgi:hypothetical protein
MVALMATVNVCWPPSARVYIGGGEVVSGDDRTVHTTNILRCVAYNPSLSHLLQAQRVGEQASKITVCRETLARVCGRSGFWGAYSARPALIKCLIVGAV